MAMNESAAITMPGNGYLGIIIGGFVAPAVLKIITKLVLTWLPAQSSP